MIYGSVCSGIEAASVAWEPLGWQPAFFSEIDKFPSAVLAHHWPDVPNFGDMTKYKEWPDVSIDLLVGGTPCQSFSVAGLRKGLDDPRGNLMLTYLAIAARYRPRWLVWENVPGVLSSNGGRDFGAFLGALGKLGFGFAWRVLDAQYVRTQRFPRAVPQRRRRVFVVGYLGDWRRAAAVLFDGESLSGNPAPRREAGQKPAATISARSTGGGGLGTDIDLDGGLTPVALTLLGKPNDSRDNTLETYVPASANPLTARMHKGVNTTADEGQTMVAHTLRGAGFDASEDGTGRGTPLMPVAIQERAVCENPDAGPDGAGVRTDGASFTLEARTVPQAVAFDCKASEIQVRTDGVHGTLRPMNHDGSHANAGGHVAVQVNMAVRRLTPTECERLQGFPDGHTRIQWRGKSADKCPDGPRYKALGNSMAVNVMEWIGERIALVDAMELEQEDVA